MYLYFVPFEVISLGNPLNDFRTQIVATLEINGQGGAILMCHLLEYFFLQIVVGDC